ncbi:MAG: hypothetical protein ABI634_03675 [Acidobacteriota bacterium]
MSSSTFTLRVPADGLFPALAGAVASRFLELCGAAAVDAARFEREVTSAAALVAPGAETIECTFVGGPSGVEATLRAGARHQTVQHLRS